MVAGAMRFSPFGKVVPSHGLVTNAALTMTETQTGDTAMMNVEVISVSSTDNDDVISVSSECTDRGDVISVSSESTAGA